MNHEYSVQSELYADEWDAEFRRKQTLIEAYNIADGKTRMIGSTRHVQALARQNREMAELLRELWDRRIPDGLTHTAFVVAIHPKDSHRITRLLADLEAK